MTQPTTLERLARKMHAVRNERDTHPESKTYDELGGCLTCLDDARALLTELMEPSEEMLAQGACYEDQDHDIFDEGHIAREVWQAMIQSILEEGK